ncbi:MAG: hypothetical protein GC168_09580 [Candidatus Hydrogenedens sp.]|nr:hypothetical protein [Candidatus Hydrogenedens sp.]
MSGQPIDIIYHIDCGGEHRYTIPIRIDPATQERTRGTESAPPDWARIDRHACPDCPLAAGQTHCLAALAICDLVDMFGHMLSYSEAIVRVEMKQRTIETRTTMQRVISSLAGLFLATSGCPSLAFLKPMARFHLPFASREETLFRSVSSYMLLQYFLHKEGKPCDLELKQLQARYVQLSRVNHSLAHRLRGLAEGDANINAVVLLDLFAQDFPNAIDKGLEELETLCRPALDILEQGGAPL